MSEPIRVKGDATAVSVWDEASEWTRVQQSLRIAQWPEWHEALLERSDLHGLVGGTALVRQYRLMLIPPRAGWNDRANRGTALAWAISEHHKHVNVVRRFLDDKKPRYQGLGMREHHLWPDRTEMGPRNRSRRVLLVCGMRDACWARAAGAFAFTTTGGVMNWPKVDHWSYGRRFVLCFDQGEQVYAERLAERLLAHSAREATVIEPPVKDLAELGEARGVGAVRKFLDNIKQPAEA